MKTCIVHSLYTPDIVGGAEISTQILAEALSSVHDTFVITVGNHKRGIKEEVINGVKVYRLPYNNLYWIGQQKNHPFLKLAWHVMNTFNVLQYAELIKLLKKENPTIVHTQNLSGISLAVWKAANKLNIPIVHTLRDYSLYEPIKNKKLSSVYQKLAARMSKQVNAVVGISNYILQTHVSKGFFPNAKKAVIYNVVEGNSEWKAKPDTASLSIGYFGQLSGNKGINFLIDAVEGLSEDIVSELLICGDGPLKQELMEKTSDTRIKFLGKLPKEKVLKVMEEVDLTIVPSTWEEPFGRIIIESYQAGTPVYGSRKGGIPEVLHDANEFSFEAKSSQVIKDSIVKYYHLPYERKKEISKQCFNHTKSFSVQALLQAHLQLYNEVVK